MALMLLPVFSFAQEGKISAAQRAADDASGRIFLIVASSVLIFGIPLAAFLMRRARKKQAE